MEDLESQLRSYRYHMIMEDTLWFQIYHGRTNPIRETRTGDSKQILIYRRWICDIPSRMMCFFREYEETLSDHAVVHRMNLCEMLEICVERLSIHEYNNDWNVNLFGINILPKFHHSKRIIHDGSHFKRERSINKISRLRKLWIDIMASIDQIDSILICAIINIFLATEFRIRANASTF